MWRIWKWKKKKKIDLPERGFEPQIFSNFSAHFLSFHGRWSSNLDKEVKNSWLYLVCQFGPNFGQTNTNVLSFHFIKTFIQLKSLVFEKHRKMLMIAILLPLLFKSHTFWPPKTQFHRKCHQRIEKYLEPEVHSSHQSGKYQVLER